MNVTAIDKSLALVSQFYPLITALVAVSSCQVYKLIRGLIKNKEIQAKKVFQSGGMPSSHSCMVISLSTAVGLQEGFSSVSFAICCVFSSIVLYDSTGVRQSVGKQAQVLNQLIDDFFKGRFKVEKLSEWLGHTVVEVVVGAIVGIMIAVMIKSIV